jgi:hypothetical protein
MKLALQMHQSTKNNTFADPVTVELNYKRKFGPVRRGNISGETIFQNPKRFAR